MATIAENLQILVDNKADIKEAIERLRDEDITKRMSAWVIKALFMLFRVIYMCPPKH